MKGLESSFLSGGGCMHTYVLIWAGPIYERLAVIPSIKLLNPNLALRGAEWLANNTSRCKAATIKAGRSIGRS